MFHNFLRFIKKTLDLFSDTRASESLVLCEREDVSDLVYCRYPVLPVMPAAGSDKKSRIICHSELHALLYRSFWLLS